MILSSLCVSSSVVPRRGALNGEAPSRNAPSREFPTRNAPPQSRLLAVDDIEDNLFLLEAIWADRDDYQLDCVSSGKAALEAIEASPPDLILLDLMMPEMSGNEVVREIRKQKDLSHIPILLMTAYDQELAAQSLQDGADGVIQKPFNVQALIERVEGML